ncbi:MAG: hypothetical protein AAFV53_17965 [Myxococcota bacterium]
MKRLLPVALGALLFALPQTAEAGFGLTAQIASVENATASSGTIYTNRQHRYPTLDYKSGRFLLQVAALDLINSIGFEDNLLFGVNGFYQMRKAPMSETVTGVTQLGATFDYDQIGEDTNFTTIQFAGRMGAQVNKKMGFGIYIVPQIGVTLASDEFFISGPSDDSTSNLSLAVGGQVQVSVWMK